MMVTRLGVAAVGLCTSAWLLDSSPTFGQEKPACEQFSWSIKREQALFGAPDLKTIVSGTKLNALPERGVALELQPNAAVAFAIPPERQPKSPTSHGGVIVVAGVSEAGSYQVTTSAEGWLDVVQNGMALSSTAHSGKRDCADVRKTVRFNLQPGPLTIQISGVDAKVIKLAVLPAE